MIPHVTLYTLVKSMGYCRSGSGGFDSQRTTYPPDARPQIEPMRPGAMFDQFNERVQHWAQAEHTDRSTVSALQATGEKLSMI